MSVCIAVDDRDTTRRCQNPPRGGSYFCNAHYDAHHRKYVQYKKLDSKAIARYSRIEDYAHDVYECLKIHAALERAYEARQKFRRVAIHPSAYDKGHDMRINMIWEWIERCASVLESIHTEMTEINAFANINVTFGEIDTDVQAQIWKSSVNASKKPREIKKRVSRAIRRVREIGKEERVWSEFIPLAQKERQAEKDRVRKVLMDMLEWFESAGDPITMKDLKWALMFRWFAMRTPYVDLAFVIHNKGRYLIVSDLDKFGVDDVHSERPSLECYHCVTGLYRRFADGYADTFISIAKGALKVLSLLDEQGLTEFSVRSARVGCNHAKMFFYVGSETVAFDYDARFDVGRIYNTPRRPQGELLYGKSIFQNNNCPASSEYYDYAYEALYNGSTKMVVGECLC